MICTLLAMSALAVAVLIALCTTFSFVLKQVAHIDVKSHAGAPPLQGCVQFRVYQRDFGPAGESSQFRLNFTQGVTAVCLLAGFDKASLASVDEN